MAVSPSPIQPSNKNLTMVKLTIPCFFRRTVSQLSEKRFEMHRRSPLITKRMLKPAMIMMRPPPYSIIKFDVSKPPLSKIQLKGSRCSSLKPNKSVWIYSRLTMLSEFSMSRFVSYINVNIII